MDSPICPQRLTKQEIIKRAEQLTKRFAWTVPDTPAKLFTICFDHIYEQFLYPEFGIGLDEEQDLGEDDIGLKVLGCYDALQNKIYLDKSFKNRSELLYRKRTFTAWHEVAHAILHGPLLRSHIDAIGDGRIVTNENSISPDAVEVFERQANLFASHVAAPKWFLDYVLQDTFRLNRPIRYIGPCNYMLDVRGACVRLTINSVQELAEAIAYYIRYRFGGLSAQALGYRIRESKWFVDVSGGPPMRSPIVFKRAIAMTSNVALH